MKITTLLPNANLPMQKKKRRGPKFPLAAVAGGGAVALIAFKKRHSRSEAAMDSNTAVQSTELTRHVADMVALDCEMAKSFRKQLEGDTLLSVPQARGVLRQAADAFEQHASQLETEMGSSASAPSAVMKKLLGAAVGAVAPIIGGSRTEPVSRTLRDDVIGLRLAAVSASMLNSAATAASEPALASIAKDGSESFTLLSEELEGLLPDAVVMEFEQRQDQAPDPSTTNDSADQLDLAFSPEQTATP